MIPIKNDVSASANRAATFEKLETFSILTPEAQALPGCRAQARIRTRFLKVTIVSQESFDAGKDYSVSRQRDGFKARGVLHAGAGKQHVWFAASHALLL